MDIQTLAAAIAVAKKINSTPEYVTAAVEAWLSEHVDPATGYVLDNTLTVEGAAAGAKQVGDQLSDLKSQIEDFFDVSYVENIFDPAQKTAQRLLDGNGGTPSISGVYDTSGYIEVSKGDKLYFYGVSGQSYQWAHAYEVYNSSKTFLSGVFGGVHILPTADSYIEITDDTAKYIRFSYTASINTAVYLTPWSAYLPYGQKIAVDKSLDESVKVDWQSLKDVAVKMDDLDPEVQDKLNTALIPQNLEKPIVHVEMDSYFWMRNMPTNFDQDTPFTVSGTKDATTLTVSGSQMPTILDSTDIMCGVVILYDDDAQTCKPYIITGFTDDTISVYPPIEKAITAGTLAPLMNDSQHLTKYGYRAWMQHINDSNPKHCEKKKYVARYCPISAYEDPPFTRLTGTPQYYNAPRNDSSKWLHQYGTNGCFIIPYANYTNVQYGIEWEISTGKNVGYLETFIGTAFLNLQNESVLKDSGYEIHIEVYADGTKIFEKIKDTNFIERICVDYTKEQDAIKLKVYYTNMRNQTDSLFVGSTTFWINENYPSEILPKNSVISEFCDSWGEFFSDDVVYAEPDGVWYKGEDWDEGASAKELKRIMSAKNGYQANVFNCSKGGTTSRWGKYWWYVGCGRFNPNVMLTDFAINDYHTTESPTFNNLIGPYGDTIVMENNPLTISEYCANMHDITEMCINSDITPVLIGGSIGASIAWSLSLIDSFAEEAG